MSKNYIYILLVLFFSCTSSNFDYSLTFETSAGKETATYEEVIDFYEKASKASNLLTLKEFKTTDSGHNLHLLKVKPAKQANNPLQILILNGIHPGEPDGIDASMLLVKKIVQGSFSLPNNIELNIVPVYNIGGMLNRNSFSRANQNGPEAYGFRGNALNYDLNRDFIKSDTQNSKAFYQLFHEVNPDVFVDTHVSNGADYQYTLTHLFTQPQQLGGDLGQYIEETFISKIEEDLASKNLPITPYVNVFNASPENGFPQFLDTPRYSSGFTSLWNSLGLLIETHMLKAYKQRVEATLAMLETIVDTSAKEAKTIQTKRINNFDFFAKAKEYHFDFKLDSTKFKTFPFLGFESEQIISKVSGQERLFYNNQKPKTFAVNYYNSYTPSKKVSIPAAYVIPKGYQNIIDLMKLNQIEYRSIEKDTTLNAEVYDIEKYQTRSSPYEGHYLHYNTQVKKKLEKVQLSAGAILIPTQQIGIRYIIETLEPETVDSFFNWNYFDAILQQKEGFSPYVFEEIAEAILKENKSLKARFDAKKLADDQFANNAYAQLNWIYKNSPYYEEAHLRYPIYRILK